MKQKIYIDPYAGRLYDFDNKSSRVYLSQVINDLLKAYGDNFVIEGFRIKKITYEPSNLIKIHIDGGRAIISSTYVEIDTGALTYDVTNLDDSGFIVISLSYRYLHTAFKNEVKFEINFFNSAATNNNLAGVTTFSKFYNETPRIILNKITFNKQNQEITSYYRNMNLFNNNNLTLLDKNYNIYPKSTHLKDIIRVIRYATCALSKFA